MCPAGEAVRPFLLQPDPSMRRFTLALPVLLALGGGAAAQDLQPLMGQPLPGLTPAELELFLRGQFAFAEPISVAEGLGPIFNDPGCGSCHQHPATGGSGTREVTRFGQAGPPFDPLEGLGGSLLQDQSLDLDCREVVPREADVTANRLTPICFGAGLLETIDDQDIIDNEANQPPHLAGFVSWVIDLSAPSDPPRPARFGWKGGVPNVITFSIDAALNEMGLTSVFLPNENAPNGDQDLLKQCDSVLDPEDVVDAGGYTRVDRFTHFQRFLAAPPQTPPAGMAGEVVFDTIGCVDCHRRAYTTADAPEAALSGIDIQPYSDFLLHDMDALGDRIVQGNASEDDMFTRALWGLRHRLSFLHDGRGVGGDFEAVMEMCIQEHVGEGITASDAYALLSQGEKDDLMRFLGSLGQVEFDYEDNGKLIKSADNDRDEFDWFFLEPLFTGEAPGSFTVDDYAAVADVEGDGDFDLREFGLFQRGFTGNLVGVDPPLPPAPGSELLVQLSSGGATVVVAPGGLVRYSVTAEAADPANQGLAMISFDLDFDGGPLTPMETPTVGPMTGFVSPVGMSNPQGFGGTPVAGGLRQAGGAQNTINNAFAPQPTGAVVPGLGGWKSPVVVARGSLVAPTTPGTYTLSMSNVMGNVITEDTTGFPFWEVQPAPVRPVRDLTIVVEAGGPEIYCVGKPTSEGCTPEFFWGGTPSLTGTDDFVIRAQKVVGGEPGLAIFGLSAQSIPFQNGTLCVGNTFGRSQTTFALGTETCEGLLQWKFRQLHMIRMGLNPGDVLHSQWYFNDSAQPDGTATGLSDALKFTIQP